MRRNLVLSVASALALLVVAFQQARAESSSALPSQTFDRTVSLAPGGSFAIENVNGPVTIVGWDRDAVEIHAVKTASSHAVADLLRVQIDVAATPGLVQVNTLDPHEDGVEVAVDYTVRVPRRVLLQEVATVNGTVRVTGVNTEGQRLNSVNGDIDVSRLCRRIFRSDHEWRYPHGDGPAGGWRPAGGRDGQRCNCLGASGQRGGESRRAVAQWRFSLGTASRLPRRVQATRIAWTAWCRGRAFAASHGERRDPRFGIAARNLEGAALRCAIAVTRRHSGFHSTWC